MRYLFEDLVLDTDRRELRRGGGLVSVEPQVFDILSYLIRNRDRVVSRDDLLNAIWDGRIVSESALTARIFAARQAIGDRGDQQRFIKTLLRKGFRFVGVVREENEPKASAVSEIVPGAKRTIALPDRPSIAVLPFANMSGDLDQEYFADGMAEEIITALSRCNWLFVIARNSSFTYKGKAVDVRQVGPELGVRYIVEGSVRRAGDRLRITAQLVDAISGVHLWADRFEGGTSDVFELQDRITESVVATIEPKLQIAEIERLRHKAAPDLDAYDLLLRAQALEYEFTDESLASSLRCLEQALAIDPSYAPAMALAAYCYAQRHHQGWGQRPDAEADEGFRMAVRALELGKDDATVLWMAAFAVRVLGAEPHRARELLNRSLQFNPNSAIALTAAGYTEVVLANPEKGLELLQRAQRLSPRDPRAWYMTAGIALAHFVARQYGLAASEASRALAQSPRYAPPLRIAAASLAKLGRLNEAAEYVQELFDVEPHLTLAKLRVRLRYMDESAWEDYAEGLRLAGLPE